MEKEAKRLFKESEGQVGEKQVMTEMTASIYKEAAEASFEIPRETPWPDQSVIDPRVTLGMMVKNEEKNLEKCLKSMVAWVDQIVIVDTGSTDKTVEIAKKYGAKVYHHPWEDSFSAGRNHVLSHIETPWMIQLDADEVMPQEDAAQIRDVVRSNHKNETNLIHMVLINKEEGSQKELSVINTGKIMRVIPTLYFKNRVHNKLVCPGHIQQTNLRIYHHGYNLDDKDYMEKKSKNTERLLLLQATEQPEDPDTHYYLTIQYLRFEDWDLAIQYGKKTIELYNKYEPQSQLQLLALHSIAVAYYHKASVKELPRETQKLLFDQVVVYEDMALNLYPDYLDANALLSSVYFALKDYEKCWKFSEKYLQVVDMLKKDQSKVPVVPINTIKNEWMICLQLAINFFEQADAEKALAFIAKAEGLLPENEKYRPSWGVFKYMITMGDPISLKNAEAIYMMGYRP
jgi:glycosyltransferase involved in cell wall biosynthesis